MTAGTSRWAERREVVRPPAPDAARWRRAPGLSLLGRSLDSGVTDPRYLVRRGDGQVLQVSELLALVLREVSPTRPPEAVAAAVSEAFGRTLGVDGLRHVLRTKLQPLGLVVDGTTPAPREAPRADPLLGLRLRGTLLPAPAVRVASRVLAPLFWPPVVVATLVVLAWLDVAVVAGADVLGAVDHVLADPARMLVLALLLTAGAVLHELGHAAACRYGGGRPGRIGVGLYLVFPAFFTDVTDSYRLSRSARVRTDLGGLYLNAVVAVAWGVVHVRTGSPVALLAVLATHLQMLQQLLPVVRLDGYWVLSDLAGVPDLFARLRPVVRGLLPGRPLDPRVAELRPASRRLVTGWVLVVLPLLGLTGVWLVASTPALLVSTWRALRTHALTLDAAVADGRPGTAALAVLSMALLILPLLGLALMAQRLGSPLLTRVLRARRTVGPRHVREFPMTAPGHRPAFPTEWERMLGAAPPDGDDGPAAPTEAGGPGTDARLTAAAFTDEAVLRQGRPVPTRGWRRGVYAATGGRLNAGPGSQERSEQALRARVAARIDGSRRVVVMSRKGGVGKTTVTLALGSTFAMLRGDRVVAVDANPDAGNLAYRVGSHPGRTLTDLLADVETIDRYAVLRQYLAQAPDSGLEVLASDDDPRITRALDRNAYGQVIDLLDHYYNLILLDTGTGILDSANQGLLHEADQLVLVLRPALDGARAAAATLDWLEEHGYGELITRAVVAVNATSADDDPLITPLEDHFGARCSAVVRIPWDRRLAPGARTRLVDLSAATRRAVTELAAAVTDNVTRGAVR
ncbi:MAG: AAA family ATPase [Actinomycetes bacterium]